MLTRTDGPVLEVWGLAMETAPPRDRRAAPTISRSHGAGELRVLSHQVSFAGHRYVAAVMAPAGPLRAQHAEMVRAMALGVASP